MRFDLFLDTVKLCFFIDQQSKFSVLAIRTKHFEHLLGIVGGTRKRRRLVPGIGVEVDTNYHTTQLSVYCGRCS